MKFYQKKKKNRRASEHKQRACLEASVCIFLLKLAKYTYWYIFWLEKNVLIAPYWFRSLLLVSWGPFGHEEKSNMLLGSNVVKKKAQTMIQWGGLASKLYQYSIIWCKGHDL